MSRIVTSVGLALGLVLLVAAPVAVQAAEFVSPSSDSNGTVIVQDSETHHNLYAAGSDLHLYGSTTGDLYAAGGQVDVSGPVEQDLVVAAGTIYVKAPVGGDVRAAGGTIYLNAPVGGDVVVMGGTITVDTQASVGGDLIVHGGEVTVNGPVHGQIRMSGGSVTLNSEVTGDVKVTANEHFMVGSQAHVGMLDYTGHDDPQVASGAVIGTVNHHDAPAHEHGVKGFLVKLIAIAFILKVLAWIVVGLLILRFLPRRAYTVVKHVHDSPWMNLGVGIVAAIVIPIVILLLFLIFIGYFAAILLALFFFLMFAVSWLMASIFMGATVIKWLTKKPDLELDWQAVVIGTVLFLLIALIPIVGLLIDLIIALMVFGAFIRIAHAEIKDQQPTTMITE